MPNRSEINPAVPMRRRPDSDRKRAPARPELLFAGAMTLVAVAAAGSRAVLPSDLVMPVVATTLLVCAAVLGMLGWRRGNSRPRDVSYKDAAGALTLIGAFAATAIEPEQLIRLLVSH